MVIQTKLIKLTTTLSYTTSYKRSIKLVEFIIRTIQKVNESEKLGIKKELYLCDKHKNTVLLGYVVLKFDN